LEKSVTKVGPRTQKNYFVTDGQKRELRDYLSRASQRARGATKNEEKEITEGKIYSLVGNLTERAKVAVLKR